MHWPNCPAVCHWSSVHRKKYTFHVQIYVWVQINWIVSSNELLHTKQVSHGYPIFCICRDLNKTFIEENGIKVLSTHASHRYRMWVAPLFPCFIHVIIETFCMGLVLNHDDDIKWKHFRSTTPFVRGIHRLPVDSLHTGQGRGVLMFLRSAPQETVEKTI